MEHGEGTGKGGVTAKAVLVGLVFVLLECGLIHYVDLMIHGSLTFHLIPAPGIIVLLFLLVWVVNTPLRLVVPRAALTTGEILVVYAMMGVGLTAPSIGLSQVLIPALAAPTYFASSSNRFAEIFELDQGTMIPSWLAPTDYAAVEGLFARTSTAPIDWGSVARTWTVPLLCWGLWAFTLFFVYICVMAILRKQWVQNEQLTFAYNVVPEQMSTVPEDGAALSPFWKSRWTWAGFLIPFLYHLFANLYVISPIFPKVPLAENLGLYLTEFPWNGSGYLYLFISFHALAFCMLLTEDMLFSLWFFYLINKILAVALHAFGINDTYSHFFSPAMNSQAAGGFLAYFAIILFMMRRHLRLVLGRAIRFEVGPDEANEPMTYRSATWGLVLGMLALVGFCAAAGANPGWAAVAIILILIYWVVLTRLVAEAGLFMAQGPWPVHDLMAKFVGTAALSTQTWTVLAFFKSIFLRWYTIMPAYVLGSFKMADRHRLNNRRLVKAMLLAIAVSIVAAFATTLWMSYTYGALNLSPWKARDLARQPFDAIRSTYGNPVPPDYKNMAVIAVGAAITLFLSAMRMNFTWWPFHPLGYVASNLYIIHYFWVHMFLAWVGVKCITRYGGIHLLRKVRPFLVGMVIGGLVSAGFWWGIDYFYNLTTHWIWSI